MTLSVIATTEENCTLVMSRMSQLSRKESSITCISSTICSSRRARSARTELAR